jgi:electron transfer flavoprotein beta subunit
MHCVCCIKQVPNTNDVKIDPDTNTLVRSGVESISNPFDVVGLEAAVRLKEAYGGTVTVISMGPLQAETCLREALSLGADRVVLLSDRAFAGADTLATSYTLARAIEKLDRTNPVDLVVCGKQAIDGDTAQTGPGIATRLGYTQLTYVVAIEEFDEAGRSIQVKRRVEGGLEVVRGTLPALLSVELEASKPRRAGLPDLVRSLRADVDLWGATEIEADPAMIGLKGSPTWVRRIFAPAPREGGPKFVGADDPQAAASAALDVLMADEAFGAGLRDRWKA